jgi:hypothetical protein
MPAPGRAFSFHQPSWPCACLALREKLQVLMLILGSHQLCAWNWRQVQEPVVEEDL